MVTTFVSIGSNLDREHNVRRAVQALESQFGALNVSPVYDSPAEGFDGPAFLNLAVQFSTQLSVDQVVDALHTIEKQLGRDESMAGFVDRTIDLDLLLFGNLIQHDHVVDVPRAELLTSVHVLKPLIDLQPDLVHPEHNATLISVWAGLDSHSKDRLKPVTLQL